MFGTLWLNILVELDCVENTQVCGLVGWVWGAAVHCVSVCVSSLLLSMEDLVHREFLACKPVDYVQVNCLLLWMMVFLKLCSKSNLNCWELQTKPALLQEILNVFFLQVCWAGVCFEDNWKWVEKHKSFGLLVEHYCHWSWNILLAAEWGEFVSSHIIFFYSHIDSEPKIKAETQK